MEVEISRVNILGKRETITLERMINNDAEIFNRKIWEIRKKMKDSIPHQMVLFFITFFTTAVRMGGDQRGFKYPFENNLIKNFIDYKKCLTKAKNTGNFKPVERGLKSVDEQLDKFITHIQLIHSSSNIIFDILNNKGKYKRKQMVNFLVELEGIKNKNMIDQDLYELFKQFNDTRNMILHENGLSLLIELNVEDLVNLIKVLKIVEFSVLSLARINCYEIKDSLIGIHPNLDEQLNNIVKDFTERYLEAYEETLKVHLTKKENQIKYKR